MLTSILALRACAGVVLLAVSSCALDARTPAASAATLQRNATLAQLAQGAGMDARPSVRVRCVQRVLERGGFDVGPSGADGRFGQLTAAAVRRLQNTYGLGPDGIVGVKTRRLIDLIANRQQTRRKRTNAQAPRGVQLSVDQRSEAPGRRADASPRAPDRPSAATVVPTSNAMTTQTAPLAIAGLAVALAATAFAVAMPRRRRARDPVDLVPITQHLYLEGQSDDPDVGGFRGQALAAEVPRNSGDVAHASRYLVDDQRKAAPVWVGAGAVRRSHSELPPGAPVVGYITIDETTAPDGAALREIEAVCASREWELKEVLHDQPTASFRGRPGLRRALAEIASGDVRGLVISNIKALAGSSDDLVALLEWFVDAEAAVVIPELGLDASTTAGYETASTLVEIARDQRGPRAGHTSAGMARLRSGVRSEGSS
jgi:peptidoglycan hydrolase-like protein with peptidoglycan-binding domain